MKLTEISWGDRDPESIDSEHKFQVGDAVITRQRPKAVAFHHSVPLSREHDVQRGKVTSVDDKKKKLVLVKPDGYMWSAYFDEAEPV